MPPSPAHYPLVLVLFFSWGRITRCGVEGGEGGWWTVGYQTNSFLPPTPSRIFLKSLHPLPTQSTRSSNNSNNNTHTHTQKKLCIFARRESTLAGKLDCDEHAMRSVCLIKQRHLLHPRAPPSLMPLAGGGTSYVLIWWNARLLRWPAILGVPAASIWAEPSYCRHCRERQTMRKNAPGVEVVGGWVSVCLSAGVPCEQLQTYYLVVGHSHTN